MFIKVFVLGRPGSGKSTVVRHLAKFAQRRNYQVECVKDYDILYQMFQKDEIDGTRKQFHPASYGGFDVLDKTVYDDALVQLEKNVREIPLLEENQLVTIEFARDDYHTALELFQPDFLENSYIFFIEADLESCIRRIHRRVVDLSEPDHHFVSDYIMRTYYNEDNWTYAHDSLKSEYPMCKEVVAVQNAGPLSELLHKINDFADMVFRRGPRIQTYDNIPKYV